MTTQLPSRAELIMANQSADQTPVGRPVTTSTEASAERAAKRKIAFASFVDENYLPGFLALLRSLAITNPHICEDFLVLHEGLRPLSVARIRELHPRVRFIEVDPERYRSYVKGDQTNYLVDKAYYILDVFRIRDYDTIITLDTDMVVLGDLSELLKLREGLAAVAQFYLGSHKLNSGLLVIQKEYLTDEFCRRIDECGRTGAYQLDKHDQGILNALLDGRFISLDAKYNFVKRRLRGNKQVPPNAVVLHFTGRHKPWQGGETGYSNAEKVWSQFDIPDPKFRSQYIELTGATHPELVIHFGTPLVAVGNTDAARKVARAHLSLGQYEQAAQVLSSVRIGLEDADTHEVYGEALMSVSRYEEARTHLLLATAAPKIAPNAFARLAQIEWVHGNNGTANRYAHRGLQVDPTHRRSRLWYARTLDSKQLDSKQLDSKQLDSKQLDSKQLDSKQLDSKQLDSAPGVAEAGDPSAQLAHVAFYMPGQGNAGDKLLPETVRLALTDKIKAGVGSRDWYLVHVHRLVDQYVVDQINRRRGLVIGGGGLFIPDTFPNGTSGWQWNVPLEMLNAITVPIAVYAVGFNTFDGQSYRRQRFTESVTRLVERSSFFGLRNHGSVQKVRDMLPEELRDKVRFQPCPTTVIRKLDPNWVDPVERDNSILLNAAYDRTSLRFGHDYDYFLNEMARAVEGLRGLAEVKCAAHAIDDERIAFDLRRKHGISLPVVPMYDFDNEAIRQAYTRTKLVIGMRGHAGMIPFGCGTPIISLISHPKMAYFLSDIDRPEWGISVHDAELGEKLPALAAELLGDFERTVDDVRGRQDELWKVTEENTAELQRLFGTDRL